MFLIRSYMRRQGRMILAQRRALDELWPDYGIIGEGALEPEVLFGRQAPCYLEIGFGMGEVLLEMARTHPEHDYLGVEVHLPGVGNLLGRLGEVGIDNVRIDRRNAVEVLHLLPIGSLAGVYLFFPDPWEKKRHHKRRLVQEAFVEQLRLVLAPGGLFHASTDCEDYARHMLDVLEAAVGFDNRSGPGRFCQGPVSRPMTKFERRGLTQGREVRDLLFERL